jgi:tRNA pseudouridine55 synthase
VRGFLNINKPPGISSRKVVDRVVELIPHVKVGHAGTLDPLATGVLVIAIGGATRLVQFLHEFRKRYTAEFLLGRTSESDDVEREVVVVESANIPARTQIESMLTQFTGEIQQVPPPFSAVKIDGERAYKLARQGKKVQLKSRSVTIYRTCLEKYYYPQLKLDIECSAGTYIRSLGRDLANSLGTCAVMSELTRTQHGPFAISESIDIFESTADTTRQSLISPQFALNRFPVVTLSDQQIESLKHGIMLDFPHENELVNQLVAVDQNEQMVALLERKGHLARPSINFANELD